MSRHILAGLVAVAVFCAPLTLRAQDEFRDIRARGEIAAQKMVDRVSRALDASRKLERTEPFEAKILLREMRAIVSDTIDLDATQRAAQIRRIDLRLNEVEQVLRQRTIIQEQKSFAERPKSKSSTYDPPGKSGAGTSLAKDWYDTGRGAQQVVKDAIREREKNVVRIGSSIEKSIPMPGESGIAFPSKEVWARISKRAETKLTAKEVALLKILNSVMSVNYDGEKFRAVIDDIQAKTGLILIIDEASREEAKVEYDDPVNFKTGAVKPTVRTILKKVLGDNRLTYVIKEGMIHVMTPKKASEMTVIRTYDVSDLVMPSGASMQMVQQMYGPFYAQQMQTMQTQQNAQQLIGLIQSLDPSYWQPNGPGSIVYFPQTQSLIVRASAEHHFQLGQPGLFGR